MVAKDGSLLIISNNKGSNIMTTDNDLMRQVNSIVAQLEDRDTAWKEQVMDSEGFALEHVGAYEYLSDVLDIEYVVSGSKDYLGARVLVAFGGPNIWINTRTNEVEGYWGGDSCIRHFDDNLGIDDVLRDMWECIE